MNRKKLLGMAGACLFTITSAGFAADPSPSASPGSKMDMSEMMKDKDMMRQMCAQMAKDPEMARMMCQEMMKNPESMKAMCDEMMKDDKMKSMCMKMMK